MVLKTQISIFTCFLFSLTALLLTFKITYFAYFSCCCSVTKSCPTFCNDSMPDFLSFTIPWSLLKLVSIESVMPSKHLILCRPLLLLPSIFPSIRVFFQCQLFTSAGQSIGVSASASVLPMNIQG